MKVIQAQQPLLLDTVPGRPQAQPSRARAVDLFAGAGGFTQGAALAGVEVIWAANHNPQAPSSGTA